MTANQASSSSSSKLWKYDVFLSFRGEDTRKGFTSHLYAALKDRGYQAYIDEDELKRGEQIKEELLRAIEEARISIILVKIMECREKLGREVLPIFYDVDPSLVRKQEGCLAEAFQKHEDGIREEKDDKQREAKEKRVKQWREALTQAANLSGHHLQNSANGNEAKLIRKIVDENIKEWLPRITQLDVAKHPIGIDYRIQDIICHLIHGGRPDDVVMFQFKSFLADVRDTASKYGLVNVQEKLVSDILQEPTKFQINNVNAGISVIKQHLRRRKVLLVIDNIDKMDQLNTIVGNHNWFGPGSRIIITTRDEHLLKRADKTFLAQKMNEEEALELFSWHAFENSYPHEGYLKLSKKVVSYCGGLPLALIVLGSLLIDRTQAQWESQLEKLEKIPEEEILEKLRISYDGLDVTQKAIFLDISCFFIGMDLIYVTKILDGCGCFARIGITVLWERCLVTVEDNKLKMHDLLREMGKRIISEKFPSHPEQWSRLWDFEQVTDVLTDKSGTGEIEGLTLDLRSSDKASFSTEAFTNMKKLRLLQLNDVELTGEYTCFPKKLVWLCWLGFPLKSIPEDLFDQPKLVAMDLKYSKLVQVSEGSKVHFMFRFYSFWIYIFFFGLMRSSFWI
ncbi:TMV resistance protein N-like [Pyrus ussuriensis x Pyrus communis]|uniref:TMV resistance protein N-like n=1 Tax=Pyrus ussuriensis x Pyrus communis TaxID=2448454 RepID=A0A5N5GT34_9ROSA|nr:TMV resistance protein N-like [Pyrus ussuriensis x Pyrus communis]